MWLSSIFLLSQAAVDCGGLNRVNTSAATGTEVPLVRQWVEGLRYKRIIFTPKSQPRESYEIVLRFNDQSNVLTHMWTQKILL